MSQSKLKSGRLRAGDITYGKNKTSIIDLYSVDPACASRSRTVKWSLRILC